MSDETEGRILNSSLNGFLNRIDAVQSEIDEIMAAAKEQCAPLRDDIKIIKTEAHDEGYDRQSFNALVAKRRDIRRANARRGKLSEDRQARFDEMEHEAGMQGELPLGGAALQDAA